ncbi:hypothetical protein MNEG_3793 [Monoraphidium neglectum]|uniref:Uncharacterized protein n=1 Tax=Monoraphidium neglectum TaxID=145388 RepID=A0A0D2MUL1_9CHLO|nr:hypothetical protein MNEG_3793 [Monoraphidium neglectum]KIZ04167.1 hypothetical protein MNEG_3793 [Monoraphidium neglectum]|eukprot:XP_013903186.1 hypothetical protein MNEG_3793 [Monoraphidium neglectum]
MTPHFPAAAAGSPPPAIPCSLLLPLPSACRSCSRHVPGPPGGAAAGRGGSSSRVEPSALPQGEMRQLVPPQVACGRNERRGITTNGSARSPNSLRRRLSASLAAAAAAADARSKATGGSSPRPRATSQQLPPAAPPPALACAAGAADEPASGAGAPRPVGADDPNGAAAGAQAGPQSCTLNAC